MFVSLSYRGGRQDSVTHFEELTSSFLVSGLCVVSLLPGEKKKAAVEAMCAGWPTFLEQFLSFLQLAMIGPMLHDLCWSGTNMASCFCLQVSLARLSSACRGILLVNWSDWLVLCSESLLAALFSFAQELTGALPALADIRQGIYSS